MTYNNVNESPQGIQEQLPEHAQQIYSAALNAAQKDGLSEQAAREVALNSVRNEYEQGSDGQWQRKSEDPPIHNKAITTGGN